MLFQGQPRLPSGATFAGGEAGWLEVEAAAADHMLWVENSSASFAALHEAYQRRIAAVEAATGQRLDNPLDAADRDWQQAEAEAMRAAGALGVGAAPPSPADFEAFFARHEGAFAGRLAELEGSHPEAAEAIAAARPVRDDALALAAGAEERLQRLMASRPGWDSWAALFAGGARGALNDPLMLGSLALGGGAGGARTVAGRILRTAAGEAAIAGGAVGLAQPVVQAWRAEAGLDAGFDQALGNTLFAMGLGAGFGAAGRGLWEGVAAMRAPARAGPVTEADVRGALAAVETEAHTAATRPAGVAAEAHEAALTAARRAVARDDPVALDDAARRAVEGGEAPAPTTGIDHADLIAAQPARTLDELYAAAPRWQGELGELGPRLASRHGAEFLDPGLKRQETTAAKMARKGYETTAELTDVVRGGFVVRSAAGADAIVAELGALGRVLDEGWVLGPTGYFDRKVLVQFADGTIGEVQLWHPALLAAKRGEGHRLYEERRAVEARNPDDPRAAELRAREREVYSAALRALEAEPGWAPVVEALTGRGGASGNMARQSASESARPLSSTSTSEAGRQAPPERGTNQADVPEMTAGRPSQSTNSRDITLENMGASGGRVNARDTLDPEPPDPAVAGGIDDPAAPPEITAAGLAAELAELPADTLIPLPDGRMVRADELLAELRHGEGVERLVRACRL